MEGQAHSKNRWKAHSLPRMRWATPLKICFKNCTARSSRSSYNLWRIWGPPKSLKKFEKFFITVDSFFVCGCKQNYSTIFQKIGSNEKVSQALSVIICWKNDACRNSLFQDAILSCFLPLKRGWFCGISELRIHFWCISARGFEVADNFPVQLMLRGVLFRWKQKRKVSGFDFPNFWKFASKMVLLSVVELW